jgi:hypothetical protein
MATCLVRQSTRGICHFFKTDYIHSIAHVRDAKLSDAAQQDRPFRDSNLKLVSQPDLFCAPEAG